VNGIANRLQGVSPGAQEGLDLLPLADVAENGRTACGKSPLRPGAWVGGLVPRAGRLVLSSTIAAILHATVSHTSSPKLLSRDRAVDRWLPARTDLVNTSMTADRRSRRRAACAGRRPMDSSDFTVAAWRKCREGKLCSSGRLPTAERADRGGRGHWHFASYPIPRLATGADERQESGMPSLQKKRTIEGWQRAIALALIVS